MSRSSKKTRSSRGLSRWGAASLVVISAAAAIGLSYLAITDVGSGEHEGFPVTSTVPETEVDAAADNAATASVDAAPASTPTPANETSVETSAPGVEEADSHRMLAIVNDTAMRGISGTCQDPGAVEISTDAGQSWGERVSPANVGATQILRVLPTDPSLVQVVALDQDCEPQVYRSVDLGNSWEGPLSVAGTWYFNPATPMQVSTPNGQQPLPCEGAELAARSDSAAIRCTDGSLASTIDGGFTWEENPAFSEVFAITSSPGSYALAQAGDETCEGVRITGLDSSEAAPLNGCFEADLSAAELTSENIALAQTDTSTLLWVGDAFVTSTDQGATWI